MSRREMSTLLRYRCGAGAPLPETPFVALVPGEAAPLLPVVLPEGVKGAARLKIATLRLREVTGQASEIHPFIPQGKGGDRWARAIVADAEALAGWRAEALAAGGAEARALLPDYLDLPAAEGLATLRHEDGRILVRLGLADGFTAEPALCAALLRKALAPQKIRAAYWLSPPEPTVSEALAEAGLPVATTPDALEPLGLAAPQPQALALDLSRDPGAEAERLQQALRPWRLPALLACLAALTFGAHQAWLGQRATQEARATRAQTEETLRATLLPSGPILDVRAQVSRALTAARQPTATAEGPDPLQMFATIAEGLRAAPEGTQVQGVEFAQGLGLMLDVTTPSFAAADALVDGLAARGFAAALADAAALEGEGVAARIEITGGAPDE